MFDRHILFFFCLRFVLSRPAAPTRCWRIGLELRCSGNRCRVTYFMTVDLFFVLARAGGTSPTITSGRLRSERWLNTLHMEKVLATIALHAVRTWNSVRKRQQVLGPFTYLGHHSSQDLQLRMLSVRSGMTSFSATTYSYLSIKLSRMCLGTDIYMEMNTQGLKE